MRENDYNEMNNNRMHQNREREIAIIWGVIEEIIIKEEEWVGTNNSTEIKTIWWEITKIEATDLSGFSQIPG